MSNLILIVEDEQAIREMLRYALEQKGFVVDEAESAQQAREKMAELRPDLVIVDWMMPGESGIKFIGRLRKDSVFSSLPVIMLTARVEEVDKVSGLDNGADDYLTKPVAIKELISRVNALLRRCKPDQEGDLLKHDVIKLNLATHQLFIEGKDVHIGQTEFNILKFFIEHQGRVYSRAQILDFVWGQSVFIEDRTVDVHILRLRKILRAHGLNKLIKTVRGAGYMLNPGN
ncbi:MAG: phosphate regulon transcriptional regulator PhoB [bacterium]